MRAWVLAKHRQGTLWHAQHVHALLQAACGLEGHARTVQRHVKRLGCCWVRTNNRPRSLREQATVRQQRPEDLSAIRSNRQRPAEERDHVVYVEESFLPHQPGGQYAWFSEHDCVERMSGQGRRGCCMPAMQENALSAGAFLAVEAQHGRGDAHAPCDWEIFPPWFTAQ
jgi:hypothetical protein